MDARRQERAVPVFRRQRDGPEHAVHGARGGRFPDARAAADGRTRFVLARRLAPRVRSEFPLGAVLEGLSRRSDDARLHRGSRRLEHRARSARELERRLADVGRKRRVLPFRPRRTDHALPIRHADAARGTRDCERRPRHHLRVGGRRRDRLLAVRNPSRVRSGDARDDAGPRNDRGRSAATATALGESRRPHREREHLADGRARRLRSARPDHHRAGRARRRPQRQRRAAHGQPGPGLVARRQIHRVLFRRVGGIRADDPRSARSRAAALDRARVLVLLFAGLA